MEQNNNISTILNVYFIYSDEINERFIGHLINNRKFCISCGESCDDCRLDYGTYSRNISGIYYIEDNLPEFLDEPEKYLPTEMPSTDILIALKLHPDILASLPSFCKEHGIKGLIVPSEDKEWVPFGLQKQMEEELKEYGIQFVFPRPYCSMESNGQPLIQQFIDYFRIGKPKLKLVILNDHIIDGKVEISSPCGCLWYLNRELRRYQPKIDGSLKEVISKAHHSYPCNASMVEDRILGDAPLHIAGYLHRECVYNAIINFVPNGAFQFIKEELKELKEILTPRVR
ncbi:MAG: DUF166 domain-containing protein [Promethearchaeota archaeon]